MCVCVSVSLSVCLSICVSDIIIHTHSQDLIMAHAVKRIMFCTADTKKHLFVLVAKNPETGPEGVYSHIFFTARKEQVSVHECSVIRVPATKTGGPSWV